MAPYTYLFFDDVRLSMRRNLERRLGTPRLLPEGELKHPDGLNLCAGFPGVFFDKEAGIYNMLVCAWTQEPRFSVELAQSSDGVHWQMTDTRELHPV